MSAQVRQTKNPDRLEIFEYYEPLLSSVACSILGNNLEVQSLLQEILQIWLQVPESDVPEARTFLVTTIAARATAALAAAQPHWVSPCQVARPVGSDASCSVEPPSTNKSVFKLALRVLDGLPAKERSAFFLRTVFNCKYREIGRIIGKDEIECCKMVRKVKKHMLANRSDVDL